VYVGGAVECFEVCVCECACLSVSVECFYVCLCMSVCVSVRVVSCLCLFQCLSLYVGVYVCVAIFFSTPIFPSLRTHPQKRSGRSICGTITLTHTHTHTLPLSYPALLLSLNLPPSLYRMHPQRPWGRSMCGTTLHPTTSPGPRHPPALWTIRMIHRMELSRISSWITNSRITRSLEGIFSCALISLMGFFSYV